MENLEVKFELEKLTLHILQDWCAFPDVNPNFVIWYNKVKNTPELYTRIENLLDENKSPRQIATLLYRENW